MLDSYRSCTLTVYVARKVVRICQCLFSVCDTDLGLCAACTRVCIYGYVSLTLGLGEFRLMSVVARYKSVASSKRRQSCL